MRNRGADAQPADSVGKGLYRIGGAAALIAAVVFRRNLGAEVTLLTGQVPPITVLGWFTLLQNNALLGLTFLNVFDVVDYALVGLTFLALYAALRRTNESYATLAAFLAFLGIAIYVASNQAFALLSLSDQYAAATTDALRSQLLAAGQAVLAISNNESYQGAGVYLSFLLISVAGLIISTVMLQARIFGKAAAQVGIMANVLGLGYYIALAFAPAVSFVPVSASAIFLVVWYVLIARRLFHLGSGVSSSLGMEASIG